MSDLAPAYAVVVDGSPLPQEQLNQLKEIRVANYLRLPDVCTLHMSFSDPADLDATAFKVGGSLEVKTGESGDVADTTQTVFWGKVATLEPEFGTGGIALIVRAFDRAHPMMTGRMTRSFQNVTLGDVFNKLIPEAGLSATVNDSPSVVHPYLQQDNETNWDFLWRLADREGYEFVVQNKQAILQKPGGGDQLELKWQEGLMEFRPRLTSVQQVGTVTVAGWDRKTKAAVSGQATTPAGDAKLGIERDAVKDGNGTLVIATEPVMAQGEANSLAQAVLDRVGNAYATAEGIAIGDPKIQAGITVKITGIGDHFGGTYHVAHVEHILKGSGYETHFASTVPTVLGAVGNGNGNGSPDWPSHLVVGIVTNNKDPDNEGKLRVKYPGLDGGDMEGNWARLLTPNAGSGGRGLMMIPQVNDEVLVGFLGDDSRHPYILGSVFNGVDQPDAEMIKDPDKSENFVVTTNGRAMVTSKGDMILTTKGGSAQNDRKDGALTITVQDAVAQTSQKDWTVETKQAGVSHKSAQAYEIQAQTDVKLTAQAGVTIKGTSTVSVESTAGVEIKCGGSSVKVDMSGVTISGPLIRIG